jgi:hypothetical protein
MAPEDYFELLNQIVDELKSLGLEAFNEYPGYVAVGNLHFGTANVDWGWNNEDGGLAGELYISGECRNARKIAVAIYNTVFDLLPPEEQEEFGRSSRFMPGAGIFMGVLGGSLLLAALLALWWILR